MTFARAVAASLRKYAVFEGRASRSEYWWFALFYLGIYVPCAAFDEARRFALQESLSTYFGLALMLPYYAAQARRLQDTGRSGWWLFIGAVPALGWVWLAVLLARPGTPGPNWYGGSPPTFPHGRRPDRRSSRARYACRRHASAADGAQPTGCPIGAVGSCPRSDATMSFTEAVAKCLARYADFRGRASRAEHWWYHLLMLALTWVCFAVDTACELPPWASLQLYACLIFTLPGCAVQVRRLHDVGRSGRWLWLYALPVVGWVWLLVLLARRGTAGPNRFGDPPLALAG